MPSNSFTDQKTGQLSILYAESESARAILNDFAERFRKRRVTTLDQVLNRVEGVSRSEAIRTFRSLEEIGCGEFIEGRKGHPSRFAWTDDLTAVGRAARGEVPRVSPLDDEEDDEEQKGVFEREHPLELRDDYIARVRVPADLTEREAERLATFIRSLPK